MGPITVSTGLKSVFPRHIILPVYCDAAVSMIHSKQTENNIIKHYQVLHHIADTLGKHIHMFSVFNTLLLIIWTFQSGWLLR